MGQGKRKDQIEFSSRVVFISMIGILLVFAFMLTSDSCNKFNKEVSEGIKNDPRPANHMSNYLPPSFYSELDTLEHNVDNLGKRLDSLLGVEHLVDSILVSKLVDSSDEYKMWIGGNGDTIWE